MSIEALFRYGWSLIQQTAEFVKRQTACNVKLGECLNQINCSGDNQVALDQLLDDFLTSQIRHSSQAIPLVIVSEETGVQWLGSNPEYFILIDAVDGSNNLRPWFTPAPALAVSIAVGSLASLGRAKDEHALLFSITKEIFADRYYYALTGKGAFFASGSDQYRLSSSGNQDIHSAVIGFDLDRANHFDPQVAGLLSSQIICRRLGSSILDLCQVAAGQYDAFISVGRRLKITDVCQSAFLVRAAGGVVLKDLYVNGVRDSKLNQTFLYDAIYNNPELLSQAKFAVVSAGNPVLCRKIACDLGSGLISSSL